MSGNRIKKLRTIYVNERTFKWLASDPTYWDNYSCRLKIWDSNKKLIIDTYPPAISGYVAITPHVIAEMIKEHYA
jgi:hypothetical protein